MSILTSTDNAPNAARLIESLRFTGYDNYSAIADLVDNSLDAFAGLIKIEIGQNDEDYLITIADNGIGMDLETLDQALRLGSKTTRDAKTDLGKYGLGLITASISLGERLVIITKNDGHYFTAEHDVEQIRHSDKFVRKIRPSLDMEKNFFIEKLGGSMSGTILQISKVDRLQNKNLSVLRTTLVGHLGETFREYIRAGKKIFVNNKEVSVRDPLMLDHVDTDVLSDEEHEFELDNGDTETVRLRVVCLPKFSQAESERLKINQARQGFYIMRNRRQIADGETLKKIFTKHNSLNRFRAELFISGKMDQDLGVSFTKDEIKINDAIHSWVQRIVAPQIETIRARSKKASTKELMPQVDHASSEKEIKNKAKLLPARPTHEIDESKDKDWRQVHIEEVEFLTEQHGPLAPLFTFENLGRKIKILYNADHPFYSRVFEEIGENKDLSNAIDFIIYAVADGLSRIHTEKTKPHVANFMVSFSDNLRTLLGD